MRVFSYHRLSHPLASIVLSALVLTSCSYVPSWMGGEEKPIERLPGDRVAVLPPAPALPADAAIQAVAFMLPDAVDNPSWMQQSGLLTAVTGNIAFAGSLDNKASAPIGGGEEFDRPLVPKPVVADGTVFAMDAAGKISAHEAANVATIKWQSDGVSEKDDPAILSGGLAYDQGKLYVASGRGILAAFDAATGKALWKKIVRTPFSSAPRVDGGKIFVLTTDSQLFAFNAENGEILWSHRGIDETASLMSTVSPAVSGGDVIVPYASGEIYSLAVADGSPLWSESLAAPGRTLASSAFFGIGGDPLVDNEVVFAVSSGGKLAVFVLATGKQIWEKPVSSLNTPWVAGDYLFVLADDNTVTCFVKYTGAVRWSAKLKNYKNEEKKENPILWRGPVLMAGKLAIAGSGGELVLLNAADGTIAATKEIPENTATAPVVAGGRMYLVTQDAQLVSLQ
jgi:outer membrane protein assembly factor BamB